jgi:serine/threonine-protein kinase
MYWKPLDSTEPAELIAPRRLEHYDYPIYTVTGEAAQFPASWSPDGKHLLYIQDTLGPTQRDIWVWNTDEEVRPFVRSSFEERQPAFSPDGRSVAYISDESGRFEVYVRSFPSGERAVQVSVGGGTEPVWAAGGDELFYRNDDKMMMVPISTTPSFEPGVPVLLFEKAFEYGTGFARPGYDVTPDAQRFVMILSEEDEAPARRIHVVLDWFAELERLVPTEHD